MYKTEGASREAATPGVITHDTLVSLVIEQGPKKEAGRLFLQDGIELDEVKEIRIEFLDILNIDHLWTLRGLVKLTLSHNIIEKIENLDELVHLRELDLSFNRIRIMENLENLKQVEILLLYSNEITIIQGIDNLKRLTILNIGRNKIADWEHVMYLRNFDALRSLNTYENPCVEIDGYMDYLLAFVPQLLYYRYKMISESERRSAIDKHYRVISNLEENETKECAEFAVQREFEDRVALLSLSYVEYLDEDYLFQQMFSLDEGGKTLSAINEDTRNAFEEYKKSFSAICRELYELGLKEHNKRTEEIRLFEVTVNEGKEEAQNQMRRVVDEVLEKKIKIFANMKDVTETLVADAEVDVVDGTVARAQQLLNEFNDLLSNARIQLMFKEVTLHDQIEDINKVFKINITDIVNSFLEIAQGYFIRLRNSETEYNDAINELVIHYLSDIVNETDLPPHLSNFCGDKDILAATLAASHDMHLQVINDRENRLLYRLSNWLREYTDQLITNEEERDRRQILEISHFLNFQQEELHSLGLPPQLDIPDLDLEDITSEN